MHYPTLDTQAELDINRPDSYCTTTSYKNVIDMTNITNL